MWDWIIVITAIFLWVVICIALGVHNWVPNDRDKEV